MAEALPRVKRDRKMQRPAARLFPVGFPRKLCFVSPNIRYFPPSLVLEVTKKNGKKDKGARIRCRILRTRERGEIWR